MDARQQHYLKAMGVTAWVRRELDQDVELDISPIPQVGVVATPVEKSQPQTVAPTVQSVKPEPVVEIVESAVVAKAVVDVPICPVVPAGDWDGLVQQVESCQQCALYKTRLNAVFGLGHRQADWMIIGDAPGADDDKRQQPLVGEAGLLLNAMLQAVGLKRESVYITNSLKCRPPNNRIPTPQELAACSSYLRRQIELLQPRLIIALGALTAQKLLQSEQGIDELRGAVHPYGEQEIPLIVSHHPSHLLRFPADKRQSWEDLQLAMSVCQPGSQG